MVKKFCGQLFLYRASSVPAIETCRCHNSRNYCQFPLQAYRRGQGSHVFNEFMSVLGIPLTGVIYVNRRRASWGWKSTYVCNLRSRRRCIAWYLIITPQRCFLDQNCTENVTYGLKLQAYKNWRVLCTLSTRPITFFFFKNQLLRLRDQLHASLFGMWNFPASRPVHHKWPGQVKL